MSRNDVRSPWGKCEPDTIRGHLATPRHHCRGLKYRLLHVPIKQQFGRSEHGQLSMIVLAVVRRTQTCGRGHVYGGWLDLHCLGPRRIGKGLRGSMKKEEARQAVLSAYDSWAKKYPNQASMMGGFLFFRYLQAERSDLLDFRAAGNKWPIVHAWLRDRLKD